MSQESATQTPSESGPPLPVIVAVVFSTITVLAGLAYLAMFSVVDWVVFDAVSYSVDGAEPFVIITGAILTIPIVVPTVLVAARMAE